MNNMTMKIRTPDGMDHEITEVDFKSPEEQWLEYKLSDGTMLKYRSAVTSIARSDKYDENGNPFYFVHSQSQWRTYPPESMKGEPSKRPQQQDVKPLDPNTSYR